MSCYSMAPLVLTQCNFKAGLLPLPFYAPNLDSNADFSRNYVNEVSLRTYATQQIGKQKRCIQIVGKPNGCDVVACVLCRAYDFTENGFDDDRTAIICDQCEREYHVGCLRESKIADLKELPHGKWFCCADCMRLHNVLAILVARGRMEVPNTFIDILGKKLSNNDANSEINQFYVKLIFIRCKDASEENRLLLNEAVKIFHFKSCYSQDVPCRSWATKFRAPTRCYQSILPRERLTSAFLQVV